MKDIKLCINDELGFPEPPMFDRLPIIKRAGFDGFFSLWEPGAPIDRAAALARREGLIYQSIHAPFEHVDTMWEEGEAGDAYLKMLMDCVQDCADNGVPLAIIHAIIGFDRHNPTDLGVERFAKLCRFAESRGVLLGFENTEGDEYLDRLLTDLKGYSSCRFCWDTGHEMCYNHSRDMMALYGERIAGTHLNDNFAITGKEITWLDDSHVMPFDGVADWAGIARRLNKHNFTDTLTFELTCLNKPGRNTHDRYAAWDYAEFMRQAYDRAVRVAQMVAKG